MKIGIDFLLFLEVCEGFEGYDGLVDCLST